MNFDTLTIAPPEVGCIEDVENDIDYRWLTPRAHKWIDKLGVKLMEHYGESIRPKLNQARAERGLKPL